MSAAARNGASLDSPGRRQRRRVRESIGGDAVRTLNQFLHPAAPREREPRYDLILRQVLIYLRTEIPSMALLVFTDRDADDDNPNRGSCLVFGANEAKSSHEWFSIAHVPMDGAGGSTMC